MGLRTTFSFLKMEIYKDAELLLVNIAMDAQQDLGLLARVL